MEKEEGRKEGRKEEKKVKVGKLELEKKYKSKHNINK
jgi:hypothetical protein